MTPSERCKALAMAMCPTLERNSLHKLVTVFGGVEAVWSASRKDWQERCRLRGNTLDLLARWRETWRAPDAMTALDARGIFWTVRGDTEYPASLLDLPVPPLVLFSNRALHPSWFESAAGVVGTRRASAYGIESTRWIAETLASHGITVCSGLALGIDAAAHLGALKVGGRTSALLASGVDVCYPPANRAIYRQIWENGLLVSEYPPGQPVAKWRFPERNRLIAALVPQVVIVQAGERSGALVTVDHALDLGRDVFVVPGPITSVHFRGSNRLIQQGAQILVDPLDLVSTRKIHTGEVGRGDVPERWHALYDALAEPATADNLARMLAVPVSQVYVGLLELEVAGIAVRRPGGVYMRKS